MFQCLLEVNVSSPDGFPLSQLISTISLHPLSLPQLTPKLLHALIPLFFVYVFSSDACDLPFWSPLIVTIVHPTLPYLPPISISQLESNKSLPSLLFPFPSVFPLPLLSL